MSDSRKVKAVLDFLEKFLECVVLLVVCVRRGHWLLQCERLCTSGGDMSDSLPETVTSLRRSFPHPQPLFI